MPFQCEYRHAQYLLAKEQYEKKKAENPFDPQNANIPAPVEPPKPNWGMHSKPDDVMSLELSHQFTHTTGQTVGEIVSQGAVPVRIGQVVINSTEISNEDGHEVSFDISLENLNQTFQAHLENRTSDCTTRTYYLDLQAISFVGLAQLTVPTTSDVWAYTIEQWEPNGFAFDKHQIRRAHSVIDNLVWLHPGRTLEMDIPLRWNRGDQNTLSYKLKLKPYSNLNPKKGQNS